MLRATNTGTNIRARWREQLTSPQPVTLGRQLSLLTLGHGNSLVGEVVRIAKYAMVGVSNTAVSAGVLYLFFFFWPERTEAAMVLGSSAAYAAGGINSYWWNRNWTFRAGRSGWTGLTRFAALSGICLAINSALVVGSSGWLASSLTPLWLVNGALQISGIVSGGLGYVALRLWVFKSPVI